MRILKEKKEESSCPQVDYGDDLPPVRKLQEIPEDLQKIFLTKTRDEWFDLLIRQDVPIGKVYSIYEVFEDPQIKARQMVIDVEAPKLGKIRQVGILPKLSDMPGTVRRLAPLYGEQTDEILKALGCGGEEIQKLRKKGSSVSPIRNAI